MGGIFYIFFVPLIAVVVFEFFNEKNQRTHLIPPPQTPLPSESEEMEAEKEIEAKRRFLTTCKVLSLCKLFQPVMKKIKKLLMTPVGFWWEIFVSYLLPFIMLSLVFGWVNRDEMPIRKRQRSVETPPIQVAEQETETEIEKEE